MVVIDSLTSENGYRRILEDIEPVLAGVERRSFNAHTKVAAEEIFYVAAAAPGVIATNVMVVGAEHGVTSLVLCTTSVSQRLGLYSVLVKAYVPHRFTFHS